MIITDHDRDGIEQIKIACRGRYILATPEEESDLLAMLLERAGGLQNMAMAEIEEERATRRLRRMMS